MAAIGSWSSILPSGSASISVGDDNIRDNNVSLELAWEDEHYFTDGSATSAGVHKAGSARAFSQSAAPTAVAPIGQIWHDSDDDALYIAEGAGTGNWTQVNSAGAAVGSVNTFTVIQNFTSGLSTGSANTLSLTPAGGVNMLVATGATTPSVQSGGFLFVRRGGTNYELAIRWGDGTTDIIATGGTL